jgi:hypothetical protein
LRVFDRDVNFKIDTGADVNVIPWSLIKDLEEQGNCQIQPTQKQLKSYSNGMIPLKGQSSLKVVYQGPYLDVYVVEIQAAPILGIPGIKQLKLLERVNEINFKSAGITVNEKVFQDTPGLLKGEYTIKLVSGALPKAQSPRRFPFALYPQLEKELQQMVVAVKRDNSLRICLDPRELNKVVLREHYALPTADEIFSQMHGAKYFSFLDATQGFDHIQLSSESTGLTTFHTPFGRYKWLRLPYSLVCASEVFHRRMVECLQGLEGVTVFVDDIAVWGGSRKEHDERLQKVLKRCIEEGINLNRKKCRLAVKEAKY